MKNTQMRLAALGLWLAMLPTQAQTPPAHDEIVYLRHTTPNSIVKMMHWDNAASLPKGVKFVAPDPRHNALTVRADAAGLAKVQDIARALDIAPRRVQVKAFFARASQADMDASGIDFAPVPLPPSEGADKTAPPKFAQIATGDAAAKFLKLLTDKNRITQAPTITTTNNVPAQIAVESGGFRTALAVTARINADHSITLTVMAESGSPTDKMTLPMTLRTIRNGETMVLAGGLRDADGSPLVVFLTATALTDDPPAAKP